MIKAIHAVSSQVSVCYFKEFYVPMHRNLDFIHSIKAQVGNFHLTCNCFCFIDRVVFISTSVFSSRFSVCYFSVQEDL